MEAMNHFEFLGIPQSFLVDEPALRRQFLLNSKRFHPDFFTLENEERQAEVLELSTRNNEAFKILNDPDRRMKYVLELHGVLQKEDGKNQPMPPAFLMEMMEINESLMELEFDFDAQKLAELEKQVAEIGETEKSAVAKILENWTETSSKSGELEAVRDYFLKKRYLLRVLEKLSTFARPLKD